MSGSCPRPALLKTLTPTCSPHLYECAATRAVLVREHHVQRWQHHRALLLLTLALLPILHCGCGGGGGGGSSAAAGGVPAGNPGIVDTVLVAGPASLTNTTQATFEFRSDDTNATFEARLDGGAWSAVTSPVTLTLLSEGSHRYEVRAINTNGVDDSPLTVDWQIDLTPPITIVTLAPPMFSNQTEFIIEWQAELDASVEARLDGGSWVQVTSPALVDGLDAGAHLLELRATDLAGNLEDPVVALFWEVDLTPPLTPELLTATANANDPATVDVTWTPSADIESGLARYQLYTAPTATPLVAPASVESSSILFAAPCGSFQLQVSAVDEAGNESARSAPLSISLSDCGANGTLEALQHLPLSSPTGVTLLHDFNEDGGLDIVAGGGDAITLLLATTVDGRPTGEFQTPVTPVPGSYPVAADSLVHGDWNRDSIEDLAAVGAGTLTILWGNGSNGRGNGTFTIADTTSIASFFATGTLQVGDFNEDRIADLVVAGSGGFLIFSGNGNDGRGDGTFTQSSSSAAGSARDVALADVDEDGISDLAIADYFLTRVCLYTGAGSNGQGTGNFSFSGCVDSGEAQFTPPPPAPPTIAGGPVALQFSDFNDDTIVDLVVASTTLQGNGYLSLLFGVPESPGIHSGEFTPYETLLEGVAVLDVVSADFNSDGIVDILAATADNLALLIGLGSDGLGNGLFDAPTLYDTTSAPLQLELGDVDGDGVTDVVVAVAEGIDLFLGGGGFASASGSFAEFSSSSTLGNDSEKLLVGDFNDDARLDLIFANTALSSSAPPLRHLSVALGAGSVAGQGDGSFATQLLQIPASFVPHHLLANDVNADGITDLLLASNSGELLLLEGSGTMGQGNGGFVPTSVTSFGQEIDDMLLLDIDGDAILDLVTLGNGLLAYRLGQGEDGRDSGTWGAIEDAFAATGSALAVGEFFSDGLTDIITSAGDLFLGSASSGLQEGVSLPVTWIPGRIAVGDLDGDGIDDVVGASTQLQLLLGMGNNGQGVGTFFDALPTGPTFPEAQALQVLRLDDDRQLDVVLLAGETLLTFRGTSSGFEGTGTLAIDGEATDLCSGDFNGDGVVDIAVVIPGCCATPGVSNVSIAFGIGTPPATSTNP